MKKNVSKKISKTDSLYEMAKKHLAKKEYKKAYELLKKAASSGDIFVEVTLKRTYLYHIAPSLEGGLSRASLEKRAAEGDVRAANMLASEYIDNNKGKKAFSVLSKLENTKDPDILYHLAICYELGYGVKEDEMMESQYYIRAAIAGSICAQYKLGLIYYFGQLGMPKDKPEGLKWLLTSSDQGYPVFEILSHSYIGSDTNVLEDKTSLKKLYEETLDAIDREKSDDYYVLGLCLLSGYGTKMNKAKAYKYFSLAAKDNHPASLAHMSLYYLEKKDYKKAFECAKKSAEGNSALGLILLGDCYYNGHYVERDYDQAFACYKKAYDMGSRLAQHRFGEHRMY